MKFLDLFSLLFQLLNNHRIVLCHLVLEIFTVSQGLLDLLLQILLVLDSFVAICHKLFC